MKQYRHIPTGDIVAEVPTASGYFRNIHIPNGQLICGKYIVGCKDWEEVKDKPAYTILSFVNNGKTGGEKGFIIPLNPDGFYYNAIDGKLTRPKPTFTLERLLTKPYADILSVRRETDNEVFTIGDIIQNKHYSDKTYAIKSFKEWCGDMIAVCSETYECNIKSINKVQPKEWEITSFKDTDARGNVYTDCKTKRSLQSYLDYVKKGVTIIYSVKRLSDGVEFKIGDKFRMTGEHGGLHDQKNIYTLNMFTKETAHFEFTVHITPTIKDWVKVEKLFTTEDGVDVYENDKVWIINYLGTLFESIWYKRCTVKEGMHVFSTEQAAKDYQLLNKPCISAQEILDNSLLWCGDKDILLNYVKLKSK